MSLEHSGGNAKENKVSSTERSSKHTKPQGMKAPKIKTFSNHANQVLSV